MKDIIKRPYPFYLDISLIVGMDAEDIDDAEGKIKDAVQDLYKALQHVENVMSLSVYSIYSADGYGGFKVALENKDE